MHKKSLEEFRRRINVASKSKWGNVLSLSCHHCPLGANGFFKPIFLPLIRNLGQIQVVNTLQARANTKMAAQMNNKSER